MPDVPASAPASEPTSEPAPPARPPLIPRAALVELLTFAVSLVVGIVVMPCLIYLVGQAKLGEYAHGGLFAFWRDCLVGLAHGSEPFWLVALGPYLLVWLGRAGLWLWRT